MAGFVLNVRTNKIRFIVERLHLWLLSNAKGIKEPLNGLRTLNEPSLHSVHSMLNSVFKITEGLCTESIFDRV